MLIKNPNAFVFLPHSTGCSGIPAPGSRPNPDSIPSASPDRSSSVIGGSSTQIPRRALLRVPWHFGLRQLPGSVPCTAGTATRPGAGDPRLALWPVPINTLAPSRLEVARLCRQEPHCRGDPREMGASRRSPRSCVGLKPPP